jgi:hypothetical protein
MQINILSGFHSAPAAEEAMWSFFADLTDKFTTKDVVARLKSLRVVSDVTFSEPQLPGLIQSQCRLRYPVRNVKY